MIPPLVVLTGLKASLFSAIVAGFLIESYATLSPDTGTQTVVLLGQISQQLADFENGAYPKPPANQPFSPSKSVICINALWLISLVLSITSALLSTSAQDWADAYDQLPRLARSPHQRARIRSSLSLGLLKYRVDLAMIITPTLLEISVFLFFIGLVIFFAMTHKAIGIIGLIAVALFGLAYFAASILPCIDPGSPYSTSVTTILFWSISAFLSIPAICLLVMKRLDACLASCDSLDEVRSGSSIRHKLRGWVVTWSSTINAYRSLPNPFEKLLQRAQLAPVDADREALTRFFSMIELSESKTVKFVASIPKDEIIKLMTPAANPGVIILCTPLLTVLRCYACDTPTDQLEVAVLKRSLLVCLHAVHHIAKSFIVSSESGIREISYYLHKMVTGLANVSLMQALWDDEDPAVRVTSRSICALLARLVIRDWLFPESNWLHHVIGESVEVIRNSHDDIPALDRMNLKSFVFGVLKYQGDLPAEQVTCFTETLAILMDAGFKRPFDRTIFQRQLSTLESIEQDDREGWDDVVDKLQLMFRDCFQAAAALQEPEPRLDPDLGQELDLHPYW